MSLPQPWVDKIFTKLTVTYGEAFMRTYAGIPLEDVKANWAHELAGFQQSPAAIAHGLENLPSSKPPSVLQFREICRGAPAAAFANRQAPLPQIDGPKKSPEEIAAALQRLHKRPFSGSRQWAVKLQQRELAGDALTKFQREAWRTALRAEAPQGDA